MDELANQTSPTTNGALGARFKAGLQSALSGLGGKGQSQKRLTPERVTSKGDSMKQNGVVDLTESEKDEKANAVSAPTHDTDALLGEAEHGDDDPDTQDCDDALLDDDFADNLQQSGEPVTKKPRIEPTPTIATTGNTPQTNVPQPKLDSLELEKDNNHCIGDDKEHVSDNNGGTDKKKISGKCNQILENGVNQSSDTLKSEQCDIKPITSQPPDPKGVNSADNNKVVSDVSKEKETSCSVGKTFTLNTPRTPSPSQVEEKSHNGTTSDHEKLNDLEKTELQKRGLVADHNQVDNDEKEEAVEECKPSEGKQQVDMTSETQAEKSELAPGDSVDNSIDKSVNNVQTVNSESVDDDQNGPCKPLPVLIKGKHNSEESFDMANSLPTANDGPCESSPERNRSAEDSDILTPPPVRLETTPSLTESVSQDDGDEAMEVDVPPEQDDLQTTSLQEDAIKHTMNDLIGKAVAKVDGLPISSVHTGQAWLHVSPQHSDDEAEEITLPQSSAGETSDDDSRDPYAKRRKMSATPDPGRLGKLISHLSTTLDEEASQAHRNDQDVVDEDHEVVHLKKNGLASFYDTIIKKDVISDSYHEELNSRHKELQNKNSMSTKKITKILQEVKAVREKLKQMNVRPAQRSVSTQIFTEKLQVTPEQLNAAGGKILKSTIKSEKALLELQAAERKKAADVKSAAICEAVKIKEAAKFQQLQQKDVEQGEEQSKVVVKECVVPLQPVSQLTVKTQENASRKVDKYEPERSGSVTKECDEQSPPGPQLAVDDRQEKASRKIDEQVWEGAKSDAKKCIDLPKPIPAAKFRRGYFVRKDGAIRKFVPSAHNREENNSLVFTETQPIVSATCIFCLIDDLMVTDLLIASPATIDKINEMASVLKNKEILSRLHVTNRVGYHRCCFTLILERYQREIRERIAELREFIQNGKRQFAVNLFNDDIDAVQKRLKRETLVKNNKENTTDQTPKLLNPGAELDDAGDDLRITKVKSLYKGFIGKGQPQCVVCLQYLNNGYEPDQLDATKKSVMVRKAKALGDDVMLCSLEKAAIFHHSKCKREYMAKQDVCNTETAQRCKEDDPEVIENMPVDMDRIVTSQICIICQSVKKLAGTKYKKKYYEWPKKSSAERLLAAAKSLQDEELLNLLEENVDHLNAVTYHQTCYQTYTSHLLSKSHSNPVWSELDSIIESDIIQGKKSHAISSLRQKMCGSSNLVISNDTITAYIKEQFPELKIARKPGRNDEKFTASANKVPPGRSPPSQPPTTQAQPQTAQAQPQRIAQMLAQPVNNQTKTATTSRPSASASTEVVDLTAEEDQQEKKQRSPIRNGVVIPTGPLKPVNNTPFKSKALHPAPLPPCPLTGKPGHLMKPSCPTLDLSAKEDGIVLQWNMTLTKAHAKISTYQIFGYKERAGPLQGNEWKKVGDLKALPLPMACTLTQFQTGHTYHFAVRAVDDLGRTGPFGPPKSTKLK